MPQTRAATRYGPRPAAGPEVATAFEKMAPTTKTKTKVPTISLTRFAPNLRIAGAVQKHASFRPWSGVSFQCGKKCSQTRAAPVKAPAICATRYGANFANSPEETAKPIVTAGFRCASPLPQAIAVNTPAITANAQPLVITIQPAPSAFERLSKTFATTPSPSNTRMSVPMNSPKHFPNISSLLPGETLLSLVNPVERFAHRSLPKFVHLLAFSICQIRLPGVVDGPVCPE